MMLPDAIRLQVRQRAGFACEFCGTTETDAGGELTIDHYRPRVKGGSDDLDNLVYCCPRCNAYKADYWPDTPDSSVLWNPRSEPMEMHLLDLEDGTLTPLTAIGAFTLRRLRLNRPALVARRLRTRREAETLRLLQRQSELIHLLSGILIEQASLTDEQRLLLQQLRRLLALLVAGD